MTKEKNIPYPKPMLSNVDYDDLDNFDVDSFSLTDLEYNTSENCSNFLSQLEQVLLDAKMVQIPETILVYLCCYLGTTTTIYHQKQIKSLKPKIHKLLKKHAKLSLLKFNHYISGVDSKTQSIQLDQLRHDTPGSLLVQTMRLGRMILDMTDNLSNNYNNITEKHKAVMLPHNELLTLLVPLVNEQLQQWQEDLGDRSINYAINQLVIQIGWLVGYFAYIDKELDIDALQYGMPCISIYIDYTDALLKTMLKKGKILTSQQGMDSTAEAIDTEEIASLLHKTLLLYEINELSAKTHAKTPPAMDQFQQKMLIVQSDLERLVIEFIMADMEIKVIYMSLFYFWFTLDAPLRGVPHEYFNQSSSSPFDEMTNIIHLIQKTTFKLPEPELLADLQMLNSKMESLKANLSDPKNLDNVSVDQIEYQTTKVNTDVHTLISNYLKQDYHPEIIANVLFSQWLRLSTLYGVSEQEWQKMDYYLPEILNAVRNYIATIIKK